MKRKMFGYWGLSCLLIVSCLAVTLGQDSTPDGGDENDEATEAAPAPTHTAHLSIGSAGDLYSRTKGATVSLYIDGCPPNTPSLLAALNTALEAAILGLEKNSANLI